MPNESDTQTKCIQLCFITNIATFFAPQTILKDTHTYILTHSHTHTHTHTHTCL